MDIQVKEKKQRKSDMRAHHSENIDSRENKHHGLCSTCMHKSIYFTRKTSKDAILFCEEFDIYQTLELPIAPDPYIARSVEIDENESEIKLLH